MTASALHDYTVHSFTRHQLTDKFWSEAPALGDINQDGHLDIVVGPWWYEGPAFATRHAYAPTTQTFTRLRSDGSEEDIEGYEGALGTGDHVELNEIFAEVVDLNGDGWPDIISIGYPPDMWQTDRPHAVWYENPGARGLEHGVQWRLHVIADDLYGQSMTFTDLLGDGTRVLVAVSEGRSGAAGGRVGYFVPDPSDPTRKWSFHPISWPVDEYQWYKHGLGCGDVNGDGRIDVLESDGWWEQPESLAGDPVWTYHPYPFHLGPSQIKLHTYGHPHSACLRIALVCDVSPDGVPTPVTIYGGSQMHVDDVNGDGLPDVVTSIVAHGYGLAWWEQLREAGRSGGPLFKRHLIINKKPSENKYGVSFTEMQAVEFIDIDGDGLKDIVTGKRFWAHGRDGDPEADLPAVLYWFRQVRQPDGSVDFVPYLLDDDSGAGTQIAVGDVNGDGLPDIVVATTKGAFVFIQHARQVSRREWELAQPPVVPA